MCLSSFLKLILTKRKPEFFKQLWSFIPVQKTHMQTWLQTHAHLRDHFKAYNKNIFIQTINTSSIYKNKRSIPIKKDIYSWNFEYIWRQGNSWLSQLIKSLVWVQDIFIHCCFSLVYCTDKQRDSSSLISWHVFQIQHTNISNMSSYDNRRKTQDSPGSSYDLLFWVTAVPEKGQSCSHAETCQEKHWAPVI